MQISRSNLVVILLTALVGIEGVLYVQLQSNYSNLNSSHEELKMVFAGLQSLYADLNISYHVLNTNYFELQNQYEDLNGKYASLEESHQNVVREHTKLQSSYSYLQSSYDSLKQSYNTLQRNYEIEKALCIGNSLESYYDYLREELGPTGAKWWWLTFTKSYWQTQADFAANLALHDLRLIYWPSIEEEYYEDVGEYSYDTARQKIDDIIDLTEVRRYETPTVRIKKILEFIFQHVHYETEVNDIFLAPVETLGFKSGDCDDFSILAGAFFEAVGIDSAIGFFRNENNQYHAMILVHLEDLTGYRYWSYKDLTDLGLKEGRWIIIEPQITINNQDTDWIEQWNLLVAAPLDTD